MGGDSWAARTAAVEGSYFRAEQQQAMRKHLEKMVVDGKLPASALSDPNTLYRARSTLPEHQLKFKHTKAEFPSERT